MLYLLTHPITGKFVALIEAKNDKRAEKLAYNLWKLDSTCDAYYLRDKIKA